VSLLAAEFATEKDILVALDLGGKIKQPTLELLRMCDFISPNEHELKRFVEDFDPFNDPPDAIR